MNLCDGVVEPDPEEDAAAYQAPSITFLGTLADLTLKDVGESDGSTFLGLDIGS